MENTTDRLNELVKYWRDSSQKRNVARFIGDTKEVERWNKELNFEKMTWLSDQLEAEMKKTGISAATINEMLNI